jgi:hypothetical protein
MCKCRTLFKILTLFSFQSVTIDYCWDSCKNSNKFFSLEGINVETDSFGIITIRNNQTVLWHISKFFLSGKLFVCMLLMMKSVVYTKRLLKII